MYIYANTEFVYKFKGILFLFIAHTRPYRGDRSTGKSHEVRRVVACVNPDF